MARGRRSSLRRRSHRCCRLGSHHRRRPRRGGGPAPGRRPNVDAVLAAQRFPPSRPGRGGPRAASLLALHPTVPTRPPIFRLPPLGQVPSSLGRLWSRVRSTLPLLIFFSFCVPLPPAPRPQELLGGRGVWAAGATVCRPATAAVGGVALDLGCGSGRDAVFLAQALPPGAVATVVGVDNHEGALDRARALAARAGVGHRCRFVRVDLRRAWGPGLPTLLELVAAALAEQDGLGRAAAGEQAAGPGGTLPAGPGLGGGVRGGAELGPVVLVHGCRFLDRPLLRHLRDHVLRQPGAALVWSTFEEEGQAGGGGGSGGGSAGCGEGHAAGGKLPSVAQGGALPRPGRVLARGELRRTFGHEAADAEPTVATAAAAAEAAMGAPSGHFAVLRDCMGTLNTRRTNVPASFFAAVRTPGSGSE